MDSTAEISIGTEISRRFHVIRELHTDSTAADVAFLAEDRTGSLFVLKRLVVRDECDERLLLEEETRNAGLAHANVVPRAFIQHDAGEPQSTGDEQPATWFSATEWQSGGNLSERIEAGPLENADEVLLGLARGLEYLHGHEPPILHSRLIPTNVCFSGSGEPKLLDFGHSFRPSHGWSVSAAFYYGSPERLHGEPFGWEDDMWSLGLLYAAMLSGKSAEVLFGEAEPPGTLDADELENSLAGLLENSLLRRLLSPSADLRPAASEIVAELSGASAGEASRPPSTLSRFDNHAPFGTADSFADQELLHDTVPPRRTVFSEEGPVLPEHDDENGDSETAAIVSACYAGDAVALEALLPRSGHLLHGSEEHGVPLLFLVCSKCYVTCARLLLEHGVPVDGAYQGSTPLHVACVKGDIGITQLLLQNAAAVDRTRPDGATALILACTYGHADCVRALLEHHASVHMRMRRGVSALVAACQTGHVECARLVINAGASVNEPREGGYTALHMATEAGHLDCVMLLLNNDADVEAVNDEGETALHRACGFNQRACVAALLQHEANPNAKTAGYFWFNRKLPSHFARWWGTPDPELGEALKLARRDRAAAIRRLQSMG